MAGSGPNVTNGAQFPSRIVLLQMREKITPTQIPHAKFGSARCFGRPYGRTISKTAGIICDKCFEIVRMVPPKDLQQVLNETESQAKAA